MSGGYSGTDQHSFSVGATELSCQRLGKPVLFSDKMLEGMIKLAVSENPAH